MRAPCRPGARLFHPAMHAVLRFAPAAALAAGLFLSGCTTTRHYSSSANLTVAAATREPLNLSDAKAAVIAYADDGRYAADLAAVAARAKTWIIGRTASRKPGERLAVVFDIDETVLSNLPHMRSQDFGYVPEVWEKWIERADAPALPAVREIYQVARSRDVAVLFLTGRIDPTERKGTEENLRREGMDDYAALVLKPADAPRRQTALERKTAQRAAWEAEGWTIIATIGDQDSDLGAHAERGFKLPNPFYHIP